MKKTLLVSFIILCLVAVCVAAATAAQLKEETIEHLDRALTKQKELGTKQYSGTWVEILAVRIADVNEVTAEVALSKSKARQAIELSALDPNTTKVLTIQDYIAQVITEKGKEQVYQKKLHNANFLKAVEESVNDPGVLPPPEDPNYIDEIERLESFRTACLEIVTATGGI